MPIQTEAARFLSVVSAVMSTHTGAALLAAGVDTFEKLRAKRGFNAETLEDGPVIALLTKMHGLDAAVDKDIDGDDADAVRRLHIKTRDEIQASSADERKTNSLGTRARVTLGRKLTHYLSLSSAIRYEFRRRYESHKGESSRAHSVARSESEI